MRKYNSSYTYLVESWRERLIATGTNCDGLTNAELFKYIEKWDMLDDQEEKLEAIASEVRNPKL